MIHVTWPRCIIAFFIAVAALNIGLLKLAAAGYGGLLDQHPYNKGLQYDSEQVAIQRYKDSKWRVVLRTSPMKLTILSEQGIPVTGASVAVKLIRPNDPTQDQEIQLSPIANGEYSAPITIRDGRWMLDLSISYKGSEYLVHEQFIAVSTRDIDLD